MNREDAPSQSPPERQADTVTEQPRFYAWEWRPDANTLTWSEGLEYVNVSPPGDEAISQEEFLRRVHPEDRDRLQHEMEKAVSFGAEISVEFRLRARDGLYRWFTWNGRRFSSNGRQSSWLAGVSMDVTDRHEAAEKLRERSELLAITLGSIGDGVITTDRTGRVAYLNPVAESLSGWTMEEARGLPSEEVFRIVHEETRVKAESPIHKVLKDRVVAGLANHTVLIGKEGTEVPIDDTASPILDESGNLLGAVLVFRDVSERRRIDEALQRLAAIVQSSDDAIVSKDLNGIVTSWNAAAERIYGYPADEMIGRSKARVIPPDMPHELPNILDKIRSGERIEHYETVRVRKDGRRIDLSITVSPIRDREGRIVGASTIARDISSQKRTEVTIRESEARLNGILQSAMDAIITVDECLKIVFFNSAAERMFTVRAEEALGQPIDRFIPERYHQVHGRHIRRFGETGITMRTMGELGAISGVRPNGEEFPIEASISQTEAGGRRIYTVILRDITERIRAEEARKQHQIEIEDLNERLRRSMRETHHRVRNSLQLIAALADMQAMDGNEVVSVAELRRIESQVHALAAVHDILTREAGSRSDANDLSAREMLERLMALFRAATPARPISADLDEARITAKQGSSLAVITNELVTNAMKYSDGPVMIRFRAHDSKALLEVLDQGPGFPKGFNPDVSHKTGLSLVCHVARWDLRGEIQFGKGLDGKGGRAALEIPLGQNGEPDRDLDA